MQARYDESGDVVGILVCARYVSAQRNAELARDSADSQFQSGQQDLESRFGDIAIPPTAFSGKPIRSTFVWLMDHRPTSGSAPHWLAAWAREETEPKVLKAERRTAELTIFFSTFLQSLLIMGRHLNLCTFLSGFVPFANCVLPHQ